MRKIIKKIALLLVSAAVLLQGAVAATIDVNEEAKLTISFLGISGASFSIYRVAEVSEDLKFTLTENFEGYSVSLSGLDNEGWTDLAGTLSSYVKRDKPAADGSGKTGSGGTVTFSALKTGLYLVVGSSVVKSGYTYKPEPFLVCLPNRNTDGEWEYSVTAVPKYTKTKNSSGGTGGNKGGGSGGTGDDGGDNSVDEESIETYMDRTVRKVWEDNNSADRPSEVVAQLLRDGSIYDEVTLSDENSWTYSWTDLDGEYIWDIVEKDAPEGYTVLCKVDKNVYVLTNTKSDIEDSGEDVEKDREKDKDNGIENDRDKDNGVDDGDGNPGSNPRDNNGDNNGDNPGSNSGSGTDDNKNNNGTDGGDGNSGSDGSDGGSDNGETSKSADKADIPELPNGGQEEEAPSLPQTGVQWLPVPIMAGIGILLFLLGLFGRMRQNEGNK